MDIDLNIDNYTYNDLLNVYRISNTCSLENIEKMTNQLQLISNNYSKEITFFFKKAYNIICSVFKLHNLNVINIENYDNTSKYYNEIKKIQNYENKQVDEIVSFLTDSYTDSYKKVLSSEKKLSSLNNRSLYNNLNVNTIENIVNNNVAPGNINSIKRLTQLLNLNLNSCFRSNYFKSTSSDFQYIIPSEIKNIVSMRLASIEIPNSWYLISKDNKNNYFEIMIMMLNENMESGKYIIEIPEGNYTSKSLEDYLNETYFYKSNKNDLTKYIRFSINTRSNKTSFEILQNDITISLLFSEEYNDNPLTTFGWLCGFRLTSYLNITSCISSEGLFDNGSDNYLYIIIDDYQYNTNSTNIVGFDQSVLNENVIAKIPFKNNKYSFIFNNENNPLTKIRQYNGPVNISKLHIKLIDKFGKVINLNNMDISLTIEFEILYESFNFKNISD